MTDNHTKYYRVLLLATMLLGVIHSFAQPTTMPMGRQVDTSSNKTNNNTWKNEEATISYELLHSEARRLPDTGLHTFQRRPFVQPWSRDLGNPGSPVYNLQFTPDDRVGPSLGYHIFDTYRFQLDSIRFYNTTRPYSDFRYTLGSKLEQAAGIMHTQNIKPNWNFMLEYRKVNAPGFYKIQRNNHDNAVLSTNYKSLNKRYALYAGLVYNKEQHDENGGIVNDSDLNNTSYADRKTLNTAFQNTAYSTTRSSITNVQRDFGFVLKHAYTWGPIDTTYNADSTEFKAVLHPRFSISHKLEISTEKHTYKDLAPDSARYTPLFNYPFAAGAGYYVRGGDSVYMQQKWFWVDNKLMLNGFIGKGANLVGFSAGAGNRYDEFGISPAYGINLDRSKYISNYIAGDIKKEALKEGQWQYDAHALFYLTGNYAGNFNFNASIGKYISPIRSGFQAGFRQVLGTAPYAYKQYENVYAQTSYSLKDESITSLFALLNVSKFNFQVGLRNYVLSNYIYLDSARTPKQTATVFSVNQVWLRKMFRLGHFYIDNELIYQQTSAGTPVNVPELMGRHQFSYEGALFKKALTVATGAEVRYNTAYHPAGYDAQLNRFYYQQQVYINNTPELSVFLNFSVKHFRAFIMVDQLNQLFARNTILFAGVPVYNFYNNGQYNMPVYAAQSTMLRLGFSWILIN